MKKLLFIAMAVAVAFTSCKKIAGVPTDEENARVLMQYNEKWAEMEALFNSDAEVDEVDAAFTAFITETVEMLKENKGGELVYAVLPSLFYYFDTNQKDIAFDGFREDSLNVPPFDKYHKAYLAEKKTSIGLQYTDFSCATPQGDTLALSELVGTKDYVLVDFWASWCGPCRRSMPIMQEMYIEFGDRLEILGVSLDGDYDRWVACISELDLPWKHISDLKAWECVPAGLYGVCAIPATVLIDKSGTIVARNAEPDELRIILSQE